MTNFALLAAMIGDVTRANDASLLDQELFREAIDAPLILDDFCDLLQACADDYAWELDDMGQLVAMGLVDMTLPDRSPATHVAPFDALTAVAYRLTGIYHDAGLHWDRAAEALTLPLREASEIVSAEDADLSHDAALRARLLQIVDLEEVHRG